MNRFFFFEKRKYINLHLLVAGKPQRFLEPPGKGAHRYGKYRYGYRYLSFSRYTGIWTLYWYGRPADISDTVLKVYSSMSRYIDFHPLPQAGTSRGIPEAPKNDPKYVAPSTVLL